MSETKLKIPPLPSPRKQPIANLFLVAVQYCALLSVGVALLVIGVLLFRKTFLERYFEKMTHFECTIDHFDFKPEIAMIEMHDIIIWNRHPYPREPLAKVRRARLEWNPYGNPEISYPAQSS
jgi:hypothetical protein